MVDPFIEARLGHVLGRLNVRDLTDFRPHRLEWRALASAEKDLRDTAKSFRKAAGRATSGSDLTRLEEIAEDIENLLDRISAEKDHRNEVGDRSARDRAAFEREYEMETRDDRAYAPADTSRRPVYAAVDARTGSDIDEHGNAFATFLRNPASERAKANLAAVEERVASSLTGAAGGYAVPEQLVSPIMSRARDENPFRQICRLINVSTSDVKLPLSEADATSGWVGETDTRTPTTEPTLASKTPTFGTAYANVTMTEELAEDAIIDVQQWFVEEAGRAMGEAEMTSIISGNGIDSQGGAQA